MPADFDLELDEGTDSMALTPEAATALLGAVAVAQPVSRYARRMSAVEEKLTLAGYYKSLLDSEFFDTEDAFTQRVEHEIKEFVVKRMEALVNGTPPSTEESFTPEEAKALKLWAKKLLAAKPVQPVQQSPQPAVAAQPTALPQPKKRRMARAPGAAVKPVEQPSKPPPQQRGRRSPQVRNANAIPVPTGTAFSAASEMNARQQIASNPDVQALGESLVRSGN